MSAVGGPATYRAGHERLPARDPPLTTGGPRPSYSPIRNERPVFHPPERWRAS